jgi:pimeloyl-ACP methyl ester carboxylesterase
MGRFGRTKRQPEAAKSREMPNGDFFISIPDPVPQQLRQYMKLSPESIKEWVRFSVLVLIAVSLFAYLIRSIYNLQYRLLYYPSSSMPPEESVRAGNLELWQSSGTDYRGLVATNQPGPCKGTFIVFHGNGGTAADRRFYPDVLGAHGYRVILAEYPMYGGRKGELGERAFVADGIETVRLAFEEYGGPLYILGESLGSGVAAAVAGEASVKVDGIVLITPWDTLESVAKSKFPFLPVRLLLKDKYDSIENLRSFKGKIAVVGAGRDEIIPVTHAGNLFDSLPGSAKRMWTVEGAGHNDWYMHTNSSWWEDIIGFVSGDKKSEQ